MKKTGRGGMQSSRQNYAIYCPKCGRPAARKEETGRGFRYLHFTKKGCVWHEVVQEGEDGH